ncbi:hypothetical protein ACTWP5_27380 [Streptomyces sp. 4N509B]|uniref:hypothetical protein n=1 Tax=Streptomyces sp. 4N509B TaxID=3457413 RepID=UPI003FD64480
MRDPAWEAVRDGSVVASRPSREAIRAFVRDEVEQRDGELIDALAWWPVANGEELWLRVAGETTESGWAIRPAGGGGRDA